jgi:hypothetical protein
MCGGEYCVWLFVHVRPVNRPTVKGVVFCHRSDVNVVKFELMVLNQSQMKLLGKNRTNFITAVQTLNGAATWM